MCLYEAVRSGPGHGDSFNLFCASTARRPVPVSCVHVLISAIAKIRTRVRSEGGCIASPPPFKRDRRMNQYLSKLLHKYICHGLIKAGDLIHLVKAARENRSSVLCEDKNYNSV